MNGHDLSEKARESTSAIYREDAQTMKSPFLSVSFQFHFTDKSSDDYLFPKENSYLGSG